jgi:8-oxo-dGTP pyrophosphatase MutT (NUDIX family)/GNAT superfamily N-acetyltransferase
LWLQAIGERRRLLDLGPVVGGPSAFDRDGAFGVGLFEGTAPISVAIAMPAKADDARSAHNVPGLAHISSVATLPGRWGEGLAGRVVEAVMLLARRRGYARTQLWTHATNQGALRLYDRCGFALTGRTKVDLNGEPIVHLVRELPVALPVYRPAARMLCLTPDKRVLLMHWRDPVDGHQLWEPPGGGIEPGEDPLTAVLREWDEETGLPRPTMTGEPTQVSRDAFWMGGRVIADEWFYLGHVEAATELVPTALTKGEEVSLLGWDWVRMDSLYDLEDPVDPDLPPILARLEGAVL